MKTWGAIAAVALLAGTALAAQVPVGASAKGPRIAVEPAQFDFGQAVKGKELNKEFSIRNFGAEDLVIDNVTTSCGCTAALLNDKDKIIKPGGSAPLKVTLRTSAPGKMMKSVLIRSNDPAKATYELKVEATVVEK